LENTLLGWVETHLARADVCIVSDYGKGVVTPRITAQTILLGKKFGVPVLVDPKSVGVEPLHGATLVKPNKHEAERLVNTAINDDAGFIEAGEQLARRLQGTAVLITRGALGMSLFRYGCQPLHVVTPARNVFDVTGAGDTVISVIAAALAARGTLEEAIRLASQCAAIVVGKLGTATLTRAELQACLQRA
jgi:rfaE bifunctional protein kinase chain/domain